MAELLLFTEKFPYEGGEVFLKAEIPFLARHFEKVKIFPSKVSEKQAFYIPDNVEVVNPQWPTQTRPRSMFFKHFFVNSFKAMCNIN